MVTASVLVVAAGLAVLTFGPPGLAGCDGSRQVRVAAAPEIAPVLEDVTGTMASDHVEIDGVCVEYAVDATPPQTVAEKVIGARPPAELWVPDFSVWLTRTSLVGAGPQVVSRSLARSPVVVTSPEVSTPTSWQEVGGERLSFLDPLTSSASTVALLSAFGEMSMTGADRVEMGSMMVPLAQRYGAQPDKPQTVQEVAEAVENGGTGVMTEQQLYSLQRAGKAEGLTATVPLTGTMVLDYPLAALTDDEVTREAGRRLADYLAGGKVADLLEEHGFRDARNRPLTHPPNPKLAVVEEQDPPKPEQVRAALRQWRVLTKPGRILVAVDVSGSMELTDGRRSRISLAVAAAREALLLFPDNAQIGLWAFSVGLGGGDRDFRPLVPIRPLGASRGGSQREELGTALRELARMTGGGTGLHDTALAAIRTVRDGHDAHSVNSVILLTDGQNEDPGSPSLGALVRTIERESDPVRPVEVTAIGMGPDADATALARIAEATGGRSYVARDPADISKVFIEAMLAR